MSRKALDLKPSFAGSTLDDRTEIRCYDDRGQFLGGFEPSFTLFAELFPRAEIRSFCTDGDRFPWFWIIANPAEAAS